MAAVLRDPRGGFPPKLPGPGLLGRPPAARLPGARLPGARLPGARPDPPSEPVPDGRAAPASRDAPASDPLRLAPRGAAPNPREPPVAPLRGPAGASLGPPREVPPDAPVRPGAPRVVPDLGARSGRCPPRFMTPTLLGTSRPEPRSAVEDSWIRAAARRFQSSRIVLAAWWIAAMTPFVPFTSPTRCTP